jgi:small subunit ribosomal protein S13
MPRIVNVNLPNDKTIEAGLMKIKGIGLTRAQLICAYLEIAKTKKFSELSKDKIKEISNFIDTNFVISGKLNREKVLNIKGLIKMSSYRGFRHVKGLPCRGQRTRTNATTARKLKRLKKK